jgi:hypothetical protein
MPEGVNVETQVKEVTLDVAPELQEELKAWQKASAKALTLVEELAQESEVGPC